MVPCRLSAPLPLFVALVLSAGLLWCAPVVSAAVPSNDNRADATGLQFGHTYSNTSVEATAEPGEAQPCGVTSGHSVWFKITPAAPATYVFDTDQSFFDTVLSVENAVGTTVACNDDASPATTTSRLEVALSGSQTYYIRLAGFGAAGGQFSMLVLAQPPANDDRTDATPLSLTTNQAVSLLLADTESDEPSSNGCDAGVTSTVWFRYTPTQAGRLTLDNGDWWTARLHLYDATSGTPEIIACDTYRDGDSGQYSSIVQYLSAGHQYLLQVGSPSGSSSEVARLSASFAAATAPANDAFATPTTLTSSSGATPVEGGQMTTEAFEYPLYAPLGAHSAWFRWTAPSTGVLTLSTDGFPSWVRVWTDVAHPGQLSSAEGLGTPVTVDGDQGVEVDVIAGTTYRILADRKFALPFTLTRSFVSTATAPAPPGRPTTTARKHKAIVTWSAPANGGVAITGYTVTAKRKGATPVVRRVAGTTLRSVLKKLKPGKYKVSVTAANSAGTSPASAKAKFRIR